MNIKNVLKNINEAFLLSGYARTAQELSLLSDRQLADLGVSRELLKLGASGYPWREEAQSHIIPDNVSHFKAATNDTETAADQTPIMPSPSKAA
ncbi:hypothetical protein GCM10009133_27140 [Cocleimonas flava]|uniref:Uncharacterized protein DUF1127 n=1 Tax=Cocleimonas flava TaxID=634765 RepID=A0A4R1EU02_9GAMM|nr:MULTISPECIES: DUF1127 domain-containing protein [Cocleimonas]MEB8432824.1 DUF1127 domain-containing protein [Cocleimonas sp. KMM 6892]MEC4715683.1 DUF1127 domain-containing protein [Cocleimonas sp. KMM 6895]MEC4744699.1 DUF1127 domain-containing protein [Cocleimonas sp. KMM 6896]TCJ83249.1 uncharacterized protein DUF1127 [Cocleimonas flava]